MFRQFVGILLEPISLLVLSIAFFRRYQAARSKRLLVLLIYYLVSAAGLSIASWLVFGLRNNNWIYNSLYIPAIGAFGYYFYDVFRLYALKLSVILLFGINLIYFFCRNVSVDNFFTFDSIGYSLLSISVVILCFLYFYQLLKNVTEYRIWQDESFWIASALLLYYLGSFFVFLFFNIRQHPTDEERKWMTILWGVHNVLLFLSSIIMLLSSIWIPSRNRL